MSPEGNREQNGEKRQLWNQVNRLQDTVRELNDKIDKQKQALARIEEAMQYRKNVEEELQNVRRKANDAEMKVIRLESQKESRNNLIFTFREWVMVAIALTSALAALATVALSYISS